ncbi:hypothetical protein BaRGS_00018590 [Batillaria attramentaria]|uniref:Saccharopine dehydrogenase NADP binding domain-containing protein n=1 Tax=Batillaria attramentaria TaxID=370345 RepID=A0ABD0KSH3_9CAEN
MGDSKAYDLVIFGATGFTGQFVVDEVARVAEEEGGLKWAVAGRTMAKLQKVLEQSSQRTVNGDGIDLVWHWRRSCRDRDIYALAPGKTSCITVSLTLLYRKNLEEIPIIIADVSNYQSLLDMSQQAKVVLNCVGPYRFHGEDVVKACIEGGANHFLEKMQLMYNAKAKENSLYIVGACGFDSIPADLGILYTRNNFKGDLNSVEGYLNLSHGPDGLAGNFATFESAVYGFAHADELKSLRKALFPNPLPRMAHRAPQRPVIGYNEDVGKWCLPFPGSDRSVVQRTQRYNYDNKQKRPVQFVPYFCRSSRFAAYAMAFFAVIFGIMARFSFTRALLLKFPSFFTAGTFKRGGPTMKQIKESGFSWTFFASGYSQTLDDPEAQHEEAPDKKMVTKVSGPEPGYVTTPICMVQAAVVLVKERDRLPKDGGVYTPAVAFGDTSLVERLDKHNVRFQIVEQ